MKHSIYNEWQLRNNKAVYFRNVFFCYLTVLSLRSLYSTNVVTEVVWITIKNINYLYFNRKIYCKQSNHLKIHNLYKVFKLTY